MSGIDCRLWAFRNDGAFDSANLCLLDDAERTHCSRLKNDFDRVAFARTRAELRKLVGLATSQPPADVKFRANPWGKLHLDGAGADDLDFSVSHARGLSAVALARHASIGVDVEPIRRCPDRIRIASDVFGAKVAQQLMAVDHARQDSTFLRLWTAGEAFAKSCGLGFAGLNGKIPVKVSDRDAGQVVLRDDLQREWQLISLDLGADFAGHVVVGRGAAAIACDDPVTLQLASATGIG